MTMHTITIFGLKGGSGRSMLTKVLAAALAAKGRRVAIVDTTREASRPTLTSHEAWAARCHAEGIDAGALTVLPVGDSGHLPDALAEARQRGAEIALIDTRACLTPHHAYAAMATDLVLVPFTGRLEAETVGAHLKEAGDRAPILGVNAGVGGDAARQRHAAELYRGPMLKTALPRSDLLATMPSLGRLDRLVSDLEDAPVTDMNEAPEVAEPEDMRLAWRQVQELATEVLWRLRGYRLQPA